VIILKESSQKYVDPRYEDFRPRFKQIMADGGLEQYIADRVAGRNTTPHLDEDFGVEVRQDLLWYFASDYPEIYHTAQEMLKELGANQEKAQDPEYGFGLAYLLIKSEDANASRIALDLLLEKGRPRVLTPYFSDRTEEGLLVLTLRSGLFQEYKKIEAMRLFSGYLESDAHEKAQFAQYAIQGLFILDYETGIKMLPVAISKEPEHQNFITAWWLLVHQDPVLFAGDLVRKLSWKNVDYLIRALEFSSDGFKDERASKFNSEIQRLRGEN